MRFDYKFEIRDIVLGLGIFATLISNGLTNRYNSEAALKDIMDMKSEVKETRDTNFNQSMLIREITINLNNLADTVKEIKANNNKGNVRSNRWGSDQ